MTPNAADAKCTVNTGVSPDTIICDTTAPNPFPPTAGTTNGASLDVVGINATLLPGAGIAGPGQPDGLGLSNLNKNTTINIDMQTGSFINVNTNGGTVSGNGVGLTAANTGQTFNVTLTGASITTAGPFGAKGSADGIHIESLGFGGTANVTLDAGSKLQAAGDGIDIAISGAPPSDITIKSNATIVAGLDGIRAIRDGIGDVTVANGGIIAGHLDATGFPDAPVTNGIVAHTGSGTASAVNTGIIFGDAAIDVQSFAGGVVNGVNAGGLLLVTGNNTGDGDTTGVGIFARSQGGATKGGDVNVVNTGAIIGDLATNTVGVIASLPQAGSTGNINVANTGAIVVAGFGIRTLNAGGTGDINIANAGGFVGSLNSAAISVRNVGSGSTNIGNSGALTGNGGGLDTAVISIDNTGVGANNTPTFIGNSGLIAPNNFDPSRLAIATLTRDGVVSIGNVGTIIGRVDLTDGNDIFANGSAGVWSTAGGNFFYGGNDLIANAGLIQTHGTTGFDMDGGANVVNNSGVLQVLNGGAAGTGGTGRVLFSSVGGTLQFNNAGGLIEMSTDVGNRTENTVVIQGNFNASGNSRLGVDSFLGAPGSTSDRLGVQGNVTGATSIIVHDVNPGPGAFNPTGIAVVNIGGAGNLSNFQLSSASDHFNPAFGGVLDKGLFFYFLANDPNATSTGCTLNHCVSLYSLPNATALQLPIAITAAQNIFYETALMWEDRQTEVRDWWARGPLVNIRGAGADMPVKAPVAPPPPPPPRFGVWLKGMGSWADVNNNQTQTLAGQSFTFDLGYKQDTYAIVGGVDFATPAFTNDVFVWGPMGGYVNSRVRFDQGGNTFKYTGGTVGLSASYLSGGFLGAGGWFADALVKADFLRLSVDTPLLASQGIDLGHVDVTTWGVIGNLGYRFNFGPTFFEPIGTLTYARTDIDNINNTLLGTNLNFGNGDSFRGAIGARLGTQFNWWAGHRNEVWILGRVWDEFAGNNNTVDLLNPGVPITVADDTFRHKAFGEVKAGLDFISLGAGWSAHVNGGAKFGDDFTIWNAKGGVNYKW